MEDVAHLGLGQADQFRNVRGVGVDGLQSGFDGRTGQLKIGEHLGRAVLQGLEGADDLAELHPDLEVVQGHFEGLDGRAEHFGAEAGAGAVEGLLQQGVALVDFAQHRVSAHFDAVEGDVGGAAAVGQMQTLAAHALGVAGDQEQGDPVGVARLARGAGRDDQQASGHAFQHEGLGARELVARTGLFSLQGHLFRGVMSAFVDRQGADDFTAGDLRQPFRLLGVGAAQHQGRGRGQARGQQRRRRERPAHFFQDQAHGEVAEVRAAVFLRDDHPGPAHLGHFVPGVGVVAQLDPAIAHLAEGGDGGLFLHPALRSVAKHRLFFVENGHLVVIPIKFE